MGIEKKILVTGTGRSGTSFLMHLLTELGFNTGYKKEEISGELNKYEGLNAGIEHPINSGRWIGADIVKSPEYAKIEVLEKILSTNDVIDIIIPIRNLESTAKSRENCFENVDHNYGGYWLNAKSLEEQENTHARLIYNLVEYLTDKEIRFTMIAFPRMAMDSKYLFEKLKSVKGLQENINNYMLNNYKPFKESFANVADIKKVRF